MGGGRGGGSGRGGTVEGEWNGRGKEKRRENGKERGNGKGRGKGKRREGEGRDIANVHSLHCVRLGWLLAVVSSTHQGWEFTMSLLCAGLGPRPSHRHEIISHFQ